MMLELDDLLEAARCHLLRQELEQQLRGMGITLPDEQQPPGHPDESASGA